MKKNMFSEDNWILHATSHNIEEIISEKELRERLAQKKQLRIKFGVDVTNPLIHIGNAVNLWKMREFQERGHKVVFLIGDFTSRIGDPTGKSKTRSERTKEDIEKDAKDYVAQVTKILLDDPAVFEVRRNSEWYDNMSLDEFLDLCGKITHAKLIERDMFQRRIHEGQEIYMHEMLYPVLQGYDSFKLESDLTIIGSDQLFNELIGRHYQTIFNQASQIIMTTVITPGLDGKEKQSKSLNNFIAIFDTPENKFGKIMSLPDSLIITYFRVYTFVDPKVIVEYEKELKDGKNPRDVKLQLAHDLVALYHGEEIAKKTKEDFIRVFSKKELPVEIPVMDAEKGEYVVDFLVRTKLVASKAAAKRLVDGDAIELNGKKIEDQNATISSGVLRVGKTKFVKVEVQ